MSRGAPRARKRFGQHFLTDDGVLQRIADLVHPTATDRLMEIGPGHGALTYYLNTGSERYLAVELDRDLVAPLAARFPDVEVISGDILKVDLVALLDPPGWRLVGNLPYNISSPLLGRLFSHLHLIRDMHFMFQRELAERLSGTPGTKNWGRLSVMTQYHCRVEALFDVPPQAFAPPPKVHSQVVRLLPRAEREPVDMQVFEQVLRQAFSARRKRIANGLKNLMVDWDAAQVNQDRRPDELNVAEFVRLANVVAQS